MKTRLLPMLGFVVLSLAVGHAATPDDVKFTVTRTKLDEQKAREGSNKTITTKEIAYKVTVENRTFAELKDIEVKYMIFYTDTTAGSTNEGKLKSVNGKHTIAALERSRKAEFETEPAKLVTADLDAGWYYTTGAANRARDSVEGIWFRAYSGGELIGEYVNPSSIAKKQTWKD
jgi:hypothetical protein